jgi:hypothetical protein
VQSLVPSNGFVPARPRAWLCVLLAVLFLYNPFLAAPSAVAGLHVQRTSSNRATVGASELQQFTAKQKRVSEIPARTLTEKLLFADTAVPEFLAVYESVTRVPQLLWSASLWFRPPPIR